MNECRTDERKLSNGDGLNYSTTRMLNSYLDGKAVLKYPEPRDVFPCDLIHSELCRSRTPPPSECYSEMRD
jgi:glucose-6-phosphate isomerase